MCLFEKWYRNFLFSSTCSTCGRTLSRLPTDALYISVRSHRISLNPERFFCNSTTATCPRWHAEEARTTVAVSSPPREFSLPKERKSRLMESTAVGRGRIRPKREEEEDRFPALISLRAGFSPRSLFYFSHYKAPHLRRARGKSRGIRRPLDLTGEEEKYSNRPELATERETIG